MAGGHKVTGFFLPGFFLEVTRMASGTENRQFVLGACDRMMRDVRVEGGRVVVPVSGNGDPSRYAEVVRSALRLLSLETQRINVII